MLLPEKQKGGENRPWLTIDLAGSAVSEDAERDGCDEPER
jgi:hypothetical protein